MIIEENNIKTVIFKTKSSIIFKNDYFMYHWFKKPLCIVNAYDKPIKKLDIDIWEIGLDGGTFIINKDDIGIIFSSPEIKAKEYFFSLINNFINFLQNKNLNVYQDKNDILIDGYKICGHTMKEVEHNYVCAMSFNFNMDLDLIKNICTKPMKKIPKSLSDYGITQEEIINLILALDEQNN